MSALGQVLVVGLGKVGSLVATLLHENGYEVTGVDRSVHEGLPCETAVEDVSRPEGLRGRLAGCGAVVSCLPYDLNLGIARLAHELGVHYFDLTEDVDTSREILQMARTARAVMAPQCGLAPGFIGIVGAALTRDFETLRSIELRVGALPRHPRGLLGYAFNWSPEGVVNEYLNDCDVIRAGRKQSVPAMGELETIVINGIALEAFTTSGGLGTMCDTFEGRVRELNYKTMRYRGHCELMRFFFHELYMAENRTMAGKILTNAAPPVNDDVVYVHAAVEGNKRGGLFRDEFVRAYTPRQIGGKAWRAISWTTAASVCAVLEMVERGDLRGQGFLKQEEIPLEGFLATRTGRFYAEQHPA